MSIAKPTPPDGHTPAEPHPDDLLLDTIGAIVIAGGAAVQASTPSRGLYIVQSHTPDAVERLECQRLAVRAVLAKYEPSMVCTDELVDELIMAAETGF